MNMGDLKELLPEVVNQIPLKDVLPETVIDFITLMRNTDNLQTKKECFAIVNEYLDASIECHTSNMHDIVSIHKRDAFDGFFDDRQIKDYLEQVDILSWLSCFKHYVEKIMNEKEI